MGQEGSIQAPQYTVKDGFERDQYQKQRNANTPELFLQQLSSIGVDLSKGSPKIPIQFAVPHQKILFIVCNTYTTEQYKLGSGPFADSLATAVFHKHLGYNVFYLHNSTSKIFVEWFKHILKNATNDLTLFFSGYGCAPKEEEANGKNEAMLFDDGYIKDEEISDLLNQCRSPNQKTVLLSDCCHSGTFWNLQSFKKPAPQNVISISAAKDNDGSLDSKDQGIFTLYFYKALAKEPNSSLKQVKEEVSSLLSKYQIHMDYCLTTPELEDKPLFTKAESSAKSVTFPKPTPKSKPAEKKNESAPAKKEEPAPAKKEEPAPAKKEEPAPAKKEEPAPVKREAPAPPPAEEKPAAPPAAPAKEETPAAPPAEEKPAAPAEEEKSDKSSGDEDDKSSDDEDDKSEDDKKSEKSSGDEDDKSSGDEDDKSDDE